MPTLTNKNYRFAFILITSLFFFWGFANNLNPILIPHLKKSFTLTNLQSSLVDSAVYIAYCLMALPAGMIMKRYGYKAGIIMGLLLFSGGCLVFLPAANYQEYGIFLLGLFIIASGLAMLETAANPYASLLGDPETATQRLNFSQSFNGLATTIAPIIGSKLILAKNYSDQALADMPEAARKAALASEASSVKLPYLVLSLVILLVAVIFYFTKLPDIKDKKTTGGVLQPLKHKHLAWAVVAQFFYVGAQVCVLSFFILYATKAANLSEIDAATYQGYGLGLAFMVGRFAGTFIMKYVDAPKLLRYYSLINIVLCVVAIFATGIAAIVAVIAIAFFMSIMFPTIFSLGIKNLGDDAKYGSSLIIMAIAGGAVLPPIYATIADITGNFQHGYIVPLIGFAVVWYFGWKGYKIHSSKLAAV